MPTLDIIQDPAYTATVGDLLHEMRDLVNYLLASDCELLKDFASEQHPSLTQALQAVRATAATVSLDKALEDRQQPRNLPIAARGGDREHVIHIQEPQRVGPEWKSSFQPFSENVIANS